LTAPGGNRRPFEAGAGPVLRGERSGEGPPIVLCHGLTATRDSVIHGSRALERAGHAVVTYDARGHGESEPAPAGEGYDYPALVADLEGVIDSQVGAGPALVGGHSMGAHTAVAYALGNPGGVAGLAIVGPSYTAPLDDEALGYWDGIAAALEDGGVDGFVAYIDRHQTVDATWRDSVLRFTRERMLRLRDIPTRSPRPTPKPSRRPSSSARRGGSRRSPGRAAGSRVRSPPSRRALRIPEGASNSVAPMKAPTEGTLRGIATFLAAFGIGVATYIAIADSGGGSPVCIAGGHGCQTVAESSYSHVAGIDIAIFGIVGYVLLLACALLRGDAARMGGFGLSLVGFGYSLYLTQLELFKIEAICQWCVASAVLMTLLFATNATRMLAYVGREA
jgi:pimeloyl-ACP methyl ester carboxylesterase